MFIVNIISAPETKKAVFFDPLADELVVQSADIIGLVEVQNPDDNAEAAVVPMYMCSDEYGVFFPPQLDVNFIEFLPSNEELDLGKYTDHIKKIKEFYAKVKDVPGTVEVEQKGNVTHIKRIIKRVNKIEDPKNEN